MPSFNDLVFLAGGDVSPNASLSNLLEIFLKEHAELPILEDFFLCDMQDMIDSAIVLDDEAINLPLETRYAWSLAPVDLEDEICLQYFVLFVRQMANESGQQRVRLLVKIHMGQEQSSGPLTDEARLAASLRLRRLESLYTVIDLYVWLGHRFGLEHFPDLGKAAILRGNATDEISKLIAMLGYRPPRGRGSPGTRKNRRQRGGRKHKHRRD